MALAPNVERNQSQQNLAPFSAKNFAHYAQFKTFSEDFLRLIHSSQDILAPK